MNRRHLLAGAVALPLAAALPAIPAAAVETAASALELDRAAVAGRLHQWAFYCPELGDRINAMLPRLDHVLSTSEWTGELLEVRALCKERLGREISLDWLICGDVTYPSGQPCRPFEDEPASDPADTSEGGLLRDFRACSLEERAGIMELARALARRDYAAARHWSGYLNRLAGKTIAQI